jgi:predicted transport protein
MFVNSPYIDLPFADVHDPKGLCRDVSTIGHWATGDTEVTLKSMTELPYVLGLVRQAYEAQMGNGGAA